MPNFGFRKNAMTAGRPLMLGQLTDKAHGSAIIGIFPSQVSVTQLISHTTHPHKSDSYKQHRNTAH